MKTEGSKKSFDLSVMIKGLIIGTVVGAAALFLLTMVCVGAVIKMETVPYGAVAPIVMVISCIGAFLGGYSGARVSKQNGLLLGAVSGTLLFLIMLLTGILSGGVIGTGSLLRFLLAATAGSLGGIAGVNKRKQN